MAKVKPRSWGLWVQGRKERAANRRFKRKCAELLKARIDAAGEIADQHMGAKDGEG